MLCPDCGAETEDLIQGSCARCFTKRNPIVEVPRYVDILLCAACFARKRGELWVEPGEKPREAMIDAAVMESLKLHKALVGPTIDLLSKVQDERNIQYDIMVDGTVAGLPVDSLVTTVARLKQAVCVGCSRQAGGYFNAIIQLRGDERDPTDGEREEAGAIIVQGVDRMKGNGNANAFLTKQGKVQGGHDFYVSEIDVGRILAKRLAERFDADVTESAKLFGRKAGSDIYRVTFLVRIPAYRRGDFVDLGQGPARLDHVNNKTLTLRELQSGRAVTVPRDRVERGQVIARKEHMKEMMVVSVVRDEALLLDPVTNKTHEVVLPPDLDYEMSMRTLHAVEHDGQVYVVGPPQKRGLPVL